VPSHSFFFENDGIKYIDKARRSRKVLVQSLLYIIDMLGTLFQDVMNLEHLENNGSIIGMLFGLILHEDDDVRKNALFIVINSVSVSGAIHLI
jgi:hypothetical protein